MLCQNIESFKSLSVLSVRSHCYLTDLLSLYPDQLWVVEEAVP